MAAMCSNCGIKRVSRPRGLCWGCYYHPGVKDRHEVASKFCQHGHGTSIDAVLPPDEPTKALPGSPEKIEALRSRAARGMGLWHPDDATFEKGATHEDR